MSRTDYVKMLKISNGRISDKCSLIDPEKNDDFNGYIPVVVYNESKMESKQYRTEENLKIGISIFVYDGVPKSRLMQLLYFSHMYILRSKHALCRANFKYVNTTIAKIVGPILQCFFSSKNTKFYKEKSKIAKKIRLSEI